MSSTLPLSVGRYVLRESIGRGSMGELWRADDPQIDRQVAVKLLHVPDGLSAVQREEWEQRFLREARAAGKLSHPGIVAVYDVGKAEDGRPFIVMELVEGRSLDRVLHEGPAPTENVALEWGAQLAEALDSAHKKGIVHRDVKPANVLVDKDGRARIADFGIARFSESELTQEGAFLGSPAFASPEQVRGLPVDGRSDLFSLGAVIYTLITGLRPFRGEDLATLAYEICHQSPTEPRRLSPTLSPASEAVVLKALAKEPDRRHRSGLELAEDLRAAAREPALAGALAYERTVRADQLPPGAGDPRPTNGDLERRAAAAGSAAAVLVTRATVTAVSAARAVARKLAVLAVKEWPIVRHTIGSAARSFASGLRGTGGLLIRAWRSGRAGRAAIILAGAACVGAIALVGYKMGGDRIGAAAGDERERHEILRSWRSAAPEPRQEPSYSGLVSKLTGASPARSAAVLVKVSHGLADGELTVWWDERKVLKEDLEATEQTLDVFERKLLSYRHASAEWPVSLAEGKHTLRVRVRSRERGLDLTREVPKLLEAGTRYEMKISVKSWPSHRLELDWTDYPDTEEP